MIDRPLTLISCKIWNSLHSSRSRSKRSGVAKNIGAPIMPRPFQLFRCPFRFEMSTCGFGEVRQTIRKYFKIPPLAIKCRDLWDPGVMSVDIDSLLLFRRQTAKTIDQLWDELRWCCFFCMRLNDFKYQWKGERPYDRDSTYDTRQLRRNCRSHEPAPLKTTIRCWNGLEVFKIAAGFPNEAKCAYSAWEGDTNSRDSSDVCGRSASLWHNDDGDGDCDYYGIGDFQYLQKKLGI